MRADIKERVAAYELQLEIEQLEEYGKHPSTVTAGDHTQELWSMVALPPWRLEPLKPCPFCGASAREPEQSPRYHPTKNEWVVRCSSSHCRAEITIVADGWKESGYVMAESSDPHWFLYGQLMTPSYDDRILQVRRMWNRRARRET